jgi:hypothetical protein
MPARFKERWFSSHPAEPDLRTANDGSGATTPVVVDQHEGLLRVEGGPSARVLAQRPFSGAGFVVTARVEGVRKFRISRV